MTSENAIVDGADAARLDWLEKRAWQVWKSGKVFVVTPDGNPMAARSGFGPTLRAAVDDAREKNPEITKEGKAS
jgi:hypothetical protein